NIGPRGAGASTAAAFLKKHVKEGPWAHVDIAGVAYTEKAKGYIRKGGVGVGVRLMVEFIEKRLGL
ncbi:MAG: leucyl aminopeptidase, partial [Nitrospinae bacterium]|nr:leucyl aminopeptidase [Nitrospinota bacterium]